MAGHWFPVALILLMFCASVESLIHGKPHDSVYWLAAGVLNLAVVLKP
jgi:hypothetical protein